MAGHASRMFSAPRIELQGRTVYAMHAEYSYVALLLDGEETVSLAAEECVAGTRFEVYALERHTLPDGYPVTWTPCEPLFEVVDMQALWRDEWREPVADDGSFLGSGPHHLQCAAPTGSDVARPGRTIVSVHAGYVLTAADGRHLAVCTSPGNPFEMLVAHTGDELAELLQTHACIESASDARPQGWS